MGNCEHAWVHLETVQQYERCGYGRLIRRDIFYCSRCKEISVETKCHELPAGSAVAHNLPD